MNKTTIKVFLFVCMLTQQILFILIVFFDYKVILNMLMFALMIYTTFVIVEIVLYFEFKIAHIANILFRVVIVQSFNMAF